MTESLRAALSDDDETPPGIDVAEVRARAHSIRRRRGAAVAGAVTLVAVVVAVPVALLRPDGSTAPAGPIAAQSGQPAKPASCPDTIPDWEAGTNSGGTDVDGDGEPDLVVGVPDRALVCTYGLGGDGRLSGVRSIRGDEATQVATRLATAPVPAGNQMCTAELSAPFVLAFDGPDGPSTVKVDPSGCTTITNGATTRSAAREKFRLQGLRDTARRESGCPQKLSDAADVLSGIRESTMLPEDTVRLQVCAYAEELRKPDVFEDAFPADAVVERPDAARIVAAVNGSPPATGRCTREGGAPVLVIVAVTPTEVKRVVAQVGNCRSVTDGNRSLENQPIVQELYDLTQR